MYATGIGAKLPKRVKPVADYGLGLPYGVFLTNEKWSDDFIHRVRSIYGNLDGYIFGVGAGSILATVGIFPDDKIPKGLIMVDEDPAVVLGAKVFIEALKRNPSNITFPEAYKKETLEDIEKFVIDSEKNRELKRLMKLRREEFREKIADVQEYFGKLEEMVTRIESKLTTNRKINRKNQEEIRTLFEEYARRHRIVYPLSVVLSRYHAFRKLAEDDNIDAVHSDVFNPKLVQRVAQLPRFKESTNIIYLSNARDWYNGPFEPRNIEQLKPNPPHKNVFVYTSRYDEFTLSASDLSFD